MEEKILTVGANVQAGQVLPVHTANKKRIKRYLAMGVVVLYLVGVLFGNLIIRLTSSEIGQLITSVIDNHVQKIISLEQGYINLLVTSTISILGMIIVLYLFGFFALSQLFTAIAIFSKGIVFGLLSSYIILTYGMKGMVYIGGTQIISTVLLLLLLCLAARESILFSTALLKRARKPKSTNIDVRLYNLRFLIFLAFGIGISIIEATSVLLFRGYLL